MSEHLTYLETLKGEGRTIAMDVDEVCADLLGQWLLRYNLKYNDNLLPEFVTGWNLSNYVKADAKDDIHRILDDPGIYNDILPIPYALTGVRRLLAHGFRIVYVSSCHRGTSEAKREWLLRWGFLTKQNAERDFIPATDKSLIRAEFLFDDRYENVRDFPGVGVLVNRAHNATCPWEGWSLSSLLEAPGVIWRHDKGMEPDLRVA